MVTNSKKKILCRDLHRQMRYSHCIVTPAPFLLYPIENARSSSMHFSASFNPSGIVDPSFVLHTARLLYAYMKFKANKIIQTIKYWAFVQNSDPHKMIRIGLKPFWFIFFRSVMFHSIMILLLMEEFITCITNTPGC